MNLSNLKQMCYLNRRRHVENVKYLCKHLFLSRMIDTFRLINNISLTELITSVLVVETTKHFHKHGEKVYFNYK